MDSKELVNDWDVAALAATAHLVGMNNDEEEKDELTSKRRGSARALITNHRAT